jgi:cytochrome c oxidase subunit 2
MMISTANISASLVAGLLPEKASTFAGSTDALFNFVLWVCAFFFTLVLALMVYFVLRYRHRDGQTHDPSGGHSTALEITWTAIPTLIVIGIFYAGFRQFIDQTVAPTGAYEITATARMWQWTFTYPDGTTSPELHVPAGVPVKVLLDSKDVIHSLSIPAFRIKKDVVPGRYNTVWFEPTTPGTYDLYCAGYCGTAHSAMTSRAVVHEPAAFTAWLAETRRQANDIPPIELGMKLYKAQGCAQCHSVDGSRVVGPTWKDLYGSTVPLEGGGSVIADEAYLRESIAQPNAKIHAGYPPAMQPYNLRDREMAGLIAYIKSLSAAGAASQTPATQPGLQPATAPATAASQPAN